MGFKEEMDADHADAQRFADLNQVRAPMTAAFDDMKTYQAAITKVLADPRVDFSALGQATKATGLEGKSIIDDAVARFEAIAGFLNHQYEAE